MPIRRVQVEREFFEGTGQRGCYVQGDARDILRRLKQDMPGEARMVYLDPPFQTGKTFEMRVKVGAKDWQTGSYSFAIPAYEDQLDRAQYMEMMREILTGARELLTADGTLFLHVDYRMSAYLRVMLDEIFGEGNFLNEIIWSYQSGGRAKRHFSRKHDVILFYAKSKNYYFNGEAVAVAREDVRKNHMKKHVDSDGRVYRSIRSGGKIYTYYDDETTTPGDVWDDISHLQQRDPQRTGYDTQKPEKLLERIIGCSTEEGDLVVDLFSGSGTTVACAGRMNRRFMAGDLSEVALSQARRRLQDTNAEFYFTPNTDDVEVVAQLQKGIAYYEVALTGFAPEKGGSLDNMNLVDSWALGFLREGTFYPLAQSVRTKKTPELERKLSVPVYEGEIMLRVSDVYARSFYYTIEEDDAESLENG